MIALPQQKLDALLARHAMVESELATNLTPETYVKLSREFSELGPVINAIKAMLLDLDCKRGEAAILPFLEQPVGSVSIRHKLESFAAAEGLQL